MSNTVAATGLRRTQFDASFFEEHIGQNRFSAYMGKDENAVIQVREDLTKEKGDRLTFALVNRLQGDGVTGSTTLVGNEEDLVSRSHLLTVDQRRHAVLVPAAEEQKSAIGLEMAAKPALKSWAMRDTRTKIIKAMNSVRAANTIYQYSNLTELTAIGQTVLDAWQVDNADRILFGSYGSHATDFSAGHAQLDNTDDKMKASILTQAKIMAENASPRITPIRTSGDEEWFVVFMNSYQLRDLVLSDTTFQSAQREARERSKDNPLFRGADYVWDGLIIKKIVELPTIDAANTAFSGSSVATAKAVLCGAQALGYGIAKRWKTVLRKEDDYEDKRGVGIRSMDGFEKLCFGSGAGDTDDLKQNGIVDIWTASVA